MHILVDLQGAQNGSRHRGIGRYTLSFTEALCRLTLGSHRVSLLLNGSFENCDAIRSRFDGFISESDIHIWYPFGDPSYRWIGNNVRRKASEYLREAVIHEIGADVLIVSSTVEGCDDHTVTSINKYFSDTPTAAIFYDAIPYIYEEQYLSDHRAKQWYMEKVGHLKKADLLLAISESSRQESIEHFGIGPGSVVNISTALSDEFKLSTENDDDTLSKLSEMGIDGKYILYSGASDVRKNIRRLIEAYSALPEKLADEYKLVLAGGMPHHHEQELRNLANELGSSDRVIITQWIEDPVLMSLYANASLFVFPSFHEGFGLPILEAMQFGVPVIGSNVSSVPEVIGMKEAMFDPMSVGAMTSMMARAIEDKSFRKRLIANSRERSTKFCWNGTAETALEALLRHLPAKRPQRQELSDSHHAEMIFDLLESDAQLIATEELAETIDKSLPSSRRKPNLFIDVSELHARDTKTGIQRVVRNVLQNIASCTGRRYNIVPVHTDLERDYRISNKVGARYISRYEPIKDPVPQFHRDDIFLGLDFHDVLVPMRHKSFEEMRSTGVRIYFVVYDILPLKRREFFDEEVSRNFNAWLNTICQFDGLISISKSVAMDILKWAGVTRLQRNTPLRLGWFHLGADLRDADSGEIEPEVSEILPLLDGAPVFIAVGTLEPRKQQSQIVGAMEELWRKGSEAKLVLVGKRGWLNDSFIDRLRDHSELGKRIFWFEDASDAALVALFETSDALIAASDDEGFGLPLIEATSQNVPVIARDIPVFREVMGEGAHYFEGTSARSLAHAVEEWLGLYKRGAHPVSNPASALSWAESTKRLVDIVVYDQWLDSYSQD